MLPHGPSLHPHELSWPTIVLVAVAGFKTVAGLLIVTPFAPHVSDASSIGIQSVIRGGPWLIPAVLLLLAHGRQFRTASLGVAMLLIASRQTSLAFGMLAEQVPVLALLLDVAPQVFMPYYLGKFLLEFPQPRTGPSARWLTAATRLSAVLGGAQFVAVLFRTVTAGWHRPFIYQFIVGGVDTRVSPLIGSGLCLLVLALSFVGFGGLLPEDRRRHQRLFIGWIMLMVPLLVSVVQFILAGPNQVMPGPSPQWVRLFVAILSLAWIAAPSVLAYRVIEGRARQLRRGVIRAGQVALDARLLRLMATAPLVAIAGIAYWNQDQRVADVFSRTAIAWMVVAGTSGALLLSRQRLLRGLHRWLFSEHDDAGETLFGLTGRMRQSRSIDELVTRLASGIDRALRPYRVVVLVLNESATEFVPLVGSVEPLPPSTLLAELLAAGQGVLDTQLAGGTSPMRWLPQEERYWLVDCGAQLLVPLRASDGTLNGLVALSDRRSGQPYSDDDRQWLAALAESAALTIEARSAVVRPGHAPGARADMWRVGLVQRRERALECSTCGTVDDAGTTVCRECGATLAPSLVPRLLVGKFRFERRIGRGAMGVVYRAMDLDLERPVAVKMLPGATPEYSERLRLEARAMAAVTHRHLAVVYGVEAWRGQPLLICEYMEHGTLADRLSQGPMPAHEVLGLGAGLAEALAVIHAEHLLHRDIKPSNIGFDHAGVPKLLDFGLAHLLPATRLPEETRPDIGAAGTPLYMSPEAVAGSPPAHSFDLWSLHVLLYEAIAGQHPFRRGSTDETLHAVAHATPAPLPAATGLSPERAARITSYFANALMKDAARRPPSAADAAAALRALMT